MRLHYRNVMGKISLPSNTLEKIQAEAAVPQMRRHPRKMAVAAAACVVALLLPVGAASAYGHFFHDIPDEVAYFLEPIEQASTSQDITMTIQYASVEKGTLAVYLTLEDVSGQDRLAQGAKFPHGCQADWPENADEMFHKYQFLGYDEDSHTHGFLVEITPHNQTGETLYSRDQVFTLSVDQLLLAQDKSELTLLPDWSTLPADPDTELRNCDIWSYVNTYNRQVKTSDGEVEVLRQGGWELPVTDSFTITNAGFLDSGLHIQLRYNDRESPSDYAELSLTTSDGAIIGNSLECTERERYCDVGFCTQQGYRFIEFIFDVSPAELEGAALNADCTSGGYLLDGDWEVTFSLVPIEEEVSGNGVQP